MSAASSNYALIIFLLTQSFVLCLVFQYIIINNLTAYLGIILAIALVVIANAVLSFLTLKKLMQSEYQNMLLEQQARSMEDIQELIQNIRAQRHDFINHLQTVYGLLQMNRPDSAQDYLADVVREARTSAQLVNLKQPEIGALIQRKVNQAAVQEISFNLSIQSDLRAIPLRPYQLNRVLGNLIDNAFEAVMGLEPKERFVKLEIGEDSDNYIIKVLNSGPGIKPEALDFIFQAGFSTKGHNRGLGLAIVREIVEQHGGTIQASSPPTLFTVCFPRPGGESNDS
ncbi:MAG: Spo0B domain-containing protein [Armatimonadetes bacterium]|nr:Spo0B domain-containing protein [Armatimonadota bacterium]